MKTTNTPSRLTYALALLLGAACFQAKAQDITLHAYIDANNNCVRDPGEQPVRSLYFNLDYHTGASSTQTVTTSAFTDCNGEVLLHVSNLAPGVLTNTLSLGAPPLPGNYPVDMTQYLSSCFSSNNLSYGSSIDVPFTALPDTFSVNTLLIYAETMGSSYFVEEGDTLVYCDSIAKMNIELSMNQFGNCLTAGNGYYSVTIDGQLYDQITQTNAVLYTNLTTAAGQWKNFYNTGLIGAFPWNEARMNYVFPINSLSPGLHKISLTADPYQGTTEGRVIDFYVYRDQCAKVSIYSYLDCNANCSLDSSEGPSAMIGFASATIGNKILNYTEEHDPQTGQFSGYKTIYVPSIYPGPFTLTITAGMWSPYTICPQSTYVLNNTPGAIYNYTVGIQGAAASPWEVYGTIHDGFPNYPASPAPGTTYTASISPKILKLNHCVAPGLVNTKMTLPQDLHFGGVLPGIPSPDQVNITPNGEEVIWDSLDYVSLDSLVFTILVDSQAYVDANPCIYVYMAHDGLPYYGAILRCYTPANFLRVGVPELTEPAQLNMYPNPVSEQLHLNADQELKSVRVSNLVGEVLSEVEVNSRSYDLPVQQLSPGVYILYATDASGNTAAYKFIKQ